MRELILVRHSKSKIDPGVPSHEWTLSPQGRSDCLRMADQLRTHPPSLFVTSSEPKAVETGQIMADAIGVSTKWAENLHEHDRRGTSHLPTIEAFQQAVIRMFHHPTQLLFGRETADQARVRFEGGVWNVVNEHPDERIGLVSHGTVITLLLCHYNPQIEAIPFWRSLTLPCCLRVSLPDFKIIARHDTV